MVTEPGRKTRSPDSQVKFYNCIVIPRFCPTHTWLLTKPIWLSLQGHQFHFFWVIGYGLGHRHHSCPCNCYKMADTSVSTIIPMPNRTSDATSSSFPPSPRTVTCCQRNHLVAFKQPWIWASWVCSGMATRPWRPPARYCRGSREVPRCLFLHPEIQQWETSTAPFNLQPSHVLLLSLLSEGKVHCHFKERFPPKMIYS